MRRRIFLVQLILSVTFVSCYYDKEGVLYPETSNCVPAASPSFNDEILPLLDARCNNCHAGNSPSAGIKLDTYNDVVPYATDGSLLGSIKHAGNYSPMPKNSSKLSTCEIQKVQNWITSGTLNN